MRKYLFLACSIILGSQIAEAVTLTIKNNSEGDIKVSYFSAATATLNSTLIGKGEKNTIEIRSEISGVYAYNPKFESVMVALRDKGTYELKSDFVNEINEVIKVTGFHKEFSVSLPSDFESK